MMKGERIPEEMQAKGLIEKKEKYLDFGEQERNFDSKFILPTEQHNDARLSLIAFHHWNNDACITALQLGWSSGSSSPTFTCEIA